jgi:hypothetical protein
MACSRCDLLHRPVLVSLLALACPVGSFAQTGGDATEKTRAMAAVVAAEHTEVFVLEVPGFGSPPCVNDRKPLPLIQYLEKYHYPYKLTWNPTYNIMVTIYPPHSLASADLFFYSRQMCLKFLADNH